MEHTTFYGTTRDYRVTSTLANGDVLETTVRVLRYWNNTDPFVTVKFNGVELEYVAIDRSTAARFLWDCRRSVERV